MSSNTASTPDDDPALRETLKRCSPATYYAACKFRATGEVAALRAVVLGVVERYVERDLRPKLQAPPEELARLRLSQDLGLDSLTMMEIVMIAEEVLRLTISNEDLTRLATLGDVQRFIGAKLALPAAVDDWNVAAAAEDVRRIEARASPLRSGAELGQIAP